MLFSKLRLAGFKSFVDPTELHIMAGLTGVVGPNGCGKSNLLEGLRWVMGESRPSAMRSGGMEDVIFAGAGSRPPRHYAEVSLLIDNKDESAPAPFTHEPNIEIARRINRDIGSAFKINGKDQRARDVQMLFADASTGAHSPALVRQGEIAELINAKPKTRRRILEEAAGIAGLYQRRHEAELKLRGVQTNLERLGDLLENLQSQLNVLAKQARHAKRYRKIGEELRQTEAILLYRQWQVADVALAVATDALNTATKHAATAQSAAVQSKTARDEVENLLPPLRENASKTAAALQRLEVESASLQREETRAHQTIESLKTQLAQLTLDKQREAELDSDASQTIKTLQDEKIALMEAAQGHEDALVIAQNTATAAFEDLQKVENEQTRLNEDIARLSARHHSATRLFEEAESALKKHQDEQEKNTDETSALKTKLAQGQQHLETLRQDRDACETATLDAEQTLIDAESTRVKCQAEEATARMKLSEVESHVHTLRAEISTLEHLIGREGGSDKPLMDGLGVAVGYEAALGAALGDDLRAPLIKTPKTDGAGWHSLAPYTDSHAGLPNNLPSLAEHISENSGGAAVLKRRLSQIGIVEESQGASLQSQLKPGQRLVSLSGALWRWDGYFCASQDGASQATLRLQHLNRLGELQGQLKTLDSDLNRAKTQFDTQKTALEQANTAEDTARKNRGEADHKRSETMRLFALAQSEHHLLSIQMETATTTQTRLSQDIEQAGQTLQTAKETLAELDGLDTLREQGDTAKQTVESARAAMLEKRSIQDDLHRETQTRRARMGAIQSEISGWQTRGADAAQRMVDLGKRAEEVQDNLTAAQESPEAIKQRRESLFNLTDKAKKDNQASADALALAEDDLRKKDAIARTAQDDNSLAREARARAEVHCESANQQKDAAAKRIEEDAQTTPEDLLQTLALDPDKLPELPELESKTLRLRQQRDSLGAVNLRAEEDAGELSDEYETLNAEKTDLEQAVEKLRSGISSLNREGRARLLKAFDEVSKNFSLLFQKLFNGGTAKLVLVQSDDPLDAGLEIMCQPPGKKLATLSLLSGGEQTLTAMALIFAVFIANPSPICVLDEVDAPLDDANVARFCDLLDEMVGRTQTRFLIITHHVITMARMNRLFGVTMAEQGVSQLVSVDLDAAADLVQAKAS